MAQFDIELDSLVKLDAWPDRCARCAAAGTTLVPVPPRHLKKAPFFEVPLCRDHANDWAAVAFRSRVGALLWLIAAAGSMFAMWQLQPHVARPHEQNEASRLSFMFFFGLLASFVIGGLLAWWAKAPIRVLGIQGRFATVGGVCKDFARAMAKPEIEIRPAATDVPRFDVQPYAPKPAVSMSRAGYALAILFVLAALLGSSLGLGGLELEQSTAGWDRKDWRYAALAIGVVLAYTVPLMGLRLLFSRFGGCLLFALLAFMTLGLFACRLGGSVRFGFNVAYSLAPLVLLQFLAQRMIWRWKLRSITIAIAAGTGSALALTAFTLMLGGLEPGPHQAIYVLGPIIALGSAAQSRSYATTPFCLECDGWLVERCIGSLPRSLAEVQPLIAAGQVVALVDVKPYDASPSIGDIELKVHSCPECRDRGTVVLELFNTVKGGKDGKQPIVKRAGRWQYPGESLTAIESLFPPRVELAPLAPPLDSDAAAD